MSTKFFDTKKSGIVKKNKTMKTGIIVTAIVAVTAAAGLGGYKLINHDERPNVAAQSSYPSGNNVSNNYRSDPLPRSSTGFSSFGEQSKASVAEPKKAKKQVAKHSKKHGKGKHVAKHSKKHKGKHLAKHSKKHGKKHLAKHSKKHGKKHLAKNKKKSNKAQLTSASR